MVLPEANGTTATPPPKRPFPYFVVFILSLSIIVHCLTLASLFPYVGFMVQHLLQLPDKNEVGFYAGFVASAFTFGRLLSGYPLGYAADVVGRKPVIVSGLVSVMVFSLAFGFSPTLTWAIISRFLLGVTNGIISAVRTTLREICGPEHVVFGMAYFSGATGVGVVLGASLGGLLAQPALYYPEVFSSTGLFATYPFLLPNVFGACLALVALPLVMVFVPETKDFDKQHVDREASSEVEADDGPHNNAPNAEDSRHTHGKVRGRPQLQGLDDNDPDDVQGDRTGNGAATSGGSHGVSTPVVSEEDVGLWGPNGLLATPYVKLFLLLGFVTQYVRIGYQEVYPLWVLSTEDVGGLNWGTKRIGEVLGVSGLLMAVGNLFVVPKLIKMVGLATWNRAGCVLTVAASIAVPSARALSWNDASLFVVSVVTDTILFFSQGAIVIALSVGTTSVVSSHKRGKLSGLYNAAENLGRFTGPASFAVMYAWSVSSYAHDWVDYHFVFYLCAVIMAMATVLSWRTLTPEILMKPAEREDAQGVPNATAGDDEQKIGNSFVSSPRTTRREANLV